MYKLYTLRVLVLSMYLYEICIHRLKGHKEYLPIISENFLFDRIKNLEELTSNMSEITVSLKYDPISYGKLRYIIKFTFVCFKFYSNRNSNSNIQLYYLDFSYKCIWLSIL